MKAVDWTWLTQSTVISVVKQYGFTGGYSVHIHTADGEHGLTKCVQNVIT